MRPMLLVGLMFVLMVFPAAADTSRPATDAAVSTRTIWVSTGVIASRAIQAKSPSMPVDVPVNEIPQSAGFLLRLKVDKLGDAHDIRFVRSIDPLLNPSVIAAVHASDFVPQC